VGGLEGEEREGRAPGGSGEEVEWEKSG